ncbi:MAG: protein phosphatase 2C domain-containing protein [Oscillospiraceae bacterium]|nr:protein phosphatase 2C domain-containing protein [Oscillospiraceae bacterium]
MISFAQITNVGSREINEDSVLIEKEGGRILFALADGLGGHGRGEDASQLVTAVCAEVFKNGGGLDECFTQAQERLMEQQRKERAPEEMKTTLALLLADNGKVSWGHIGDSRVYRFAAGKFAARTLDHSVPQMLVLSGEIKEKAIRYHEDRNRLLRVMGVEWESPRFELSDEDAIEPGDRYLLCSDGFWELITEKQMQRHLKKAPTPEKWLELMEQDVKDNGKGRDMDNYSAIAVFAP